MADVFISYCSLRKPAVQHLTQAIENHGFSVWFDYGLLSGTQFDEQIERELRAARAVIVIWCSYAVQSKWVRKEATLASTLGTYTPVWLEKIQLPLAFIDDDTIDLSRWDGDPRGHGLDRLMDQIAAKVGRAAAPLYLGLRAQSENWGRFGRMAWANMPVDQDFADQIAATRVGAAAFGGNEKIEEAPEPAHIIGGSGMRVAPPPPLPPPPPVSVSAQAFAQIADSLDIEDYRVFIAHFPKTPEVIPADRHSRRLAAWAAIDQTDPEAIAAFLREPSFPALEQMANAVMERAAKARQEAFAAELERRRRAAEEAKRQAEEAARREAEAKAQREAEAAAARAADEKRLGPEAFRAREAAKAGRPVAERGFPIPLPDIKDWPAPQMIAIPPGRFRMGAPANEEGSNDWERPMQDITIAHAFAMGRCAVTFAEWDAALAAGAKLPKPEDRGWGRGARPVINVSWEDAQSYIAWLNQRAGLAGRKDAYRLPTEAEWEYACRAGTTTPFSFGETISTAQANYDGNYTYGSGPKGEYRKQTLPVGSFPPNPFGLYDMHGNVREWVEDCWRNSLTGQPADGAAYTTQGCSYRVNRGGSWFYGPQNLRSADRGWNAPTDRDDILGFRLARTL